METITHKGLTFTVNVAPDECMPTPWDWAEGLGTVRKSNNGHRLNCSSDKKAGEVPLNLADRNEYQYYYDFQGVMKAKDMHGFKTKAELLEAVKSEIKYFRGWLNRDWYYVNLQVTCDQTRETDYLGGLESNCAEYINECAVDMADEMANKYYEENKFNLAISLGV